MSPRQLALVFDTEALTAAQRDAVEDAIVHQEGERAREASRSRPCRCRVPWPDDSTCVLCGHEVAA
jgi:hypothetical protein